VEWYKKVFVLTTVKQLSETNLGIRIVVLESPTLTLELLEFSGSLTRKKLLEGTQEGTEIQGHLKFGFYVPDMDACLKHLASLKINVLRVWTDSDTKNRNSLIEDPDGNLIQFFQ